MPVPVGSMPHRSLNEGVSWLRPVLPEAMTNLIASREATPMAGRVQAHEPKASEKRLCLVVAFSRQTYGLSIGPRLQIWRLHAQVGQDGADLLTVRVRVVQSLD